MVPGNSFVILILDPNHDQSKHDKEQEISKTDTENCIGLKPFFGWSAGESIYPCNSPQQQQF